MSETKQPVPTEIRYEKDEKNLHIAFDNDEKYVLSAEYLRVYSPSAEVRGHSPEDEKLQIGKEDATIESINPVGNYAVILKFDDGHDTGIYSWSWLYEISKYHDRNWQVYLDKLKAAGFERKLNG